ncbi:MAG: hypothetical protein M1831_003071 [Alyxoria varia]|nr:MAG: hypothetical protein M1831_003071 [Alyxoria varia]
MASDEAYLNVQSEPAPPDQIQQYRDRVPAAFKKIAQLWAYSSRPLPNETGDGTYVLEPKRESYWEDIKRLNPENAVTLGKVAKTQLKGEPWNDRDYLLEHLLQVASNMPPEAKQLDQLLITQLWNDLRHPPQPPESLLGKKVQYRSADGSNNNLIMPEIGAANMPYARTVKPSNFGTAVLPDPGVIFDSLMKRRKPKPHHNKISSMLFYLATVIIHDLFRTSHIDYNISTTSSYLDLSPLYGSNEDEQRRMRTFEDGKIHPDSFSEKRILGFPPGVGALLVMFNRWHNHIAENIAEINEAGRFSKPTGKNHHDPKCWERYDEDLFQTARLVTCGLYIHVILHDYIRTIINLNRTDKLWYLDPRIDIKQGPEQGCGNQVSAEFNLVYRWHSTISERDVAWIKDAYQNIFPGQNLEQVSGIEMVKALGKWEAQMSDDPLERSFGDLKRGKDHKYDDDDLVKILQESVEDCANAFGAHMIPEVMRGVEILGIKQARTWNLASLNEFRKHFNLETYQSFEEINRDQEVADTLRNLYDTPDNVELYPGLVCEEPKEAKYPGSGLMPPFTTSRAILSDAIALIRGDRFNTTDFHPRALTGWGFAEIASNKEVDFGCVFHKLFYVSFPNHYKYNSVYAHFPLTIPSETEIILSDLGKKHMYNFDKPKLRTKKWTVESYSTINSILNDKHTFGVTWGPAIEFLMGPMAKNFMLAGDGIANQKSREMVNKAFYDQPQDWYSDVKKFYETKTRELIEKESYELAGMKQVDLVRDVTNIVHVHFCAQMFMLPLKTDRHPYGIFTEYELYRIFVGVFTCVFFDVDPQKSFEVHKLSKDPTHQLGEILIANVKSIQATGSLSEVITHFFSNISKSFSPSQPRTAKLEAYGLHMIQGLLASGLNPEQLVWTHMLGTAGGMVPNQGQLFAQMLDFYFNEAPEHWPDIAAAAHQDTPEGDDKLLHYMLEGSRLGCGSAVMREVKSSKPTIVKDGKKTMKMHSGDHIFANLHKASRDPVQYPNPEKVDLTRDVESYCQFGLGPHQCLGIKLTRTALTAVLKEVAKLHQLRPAKGPQGKVRKVPAPGAEGYWRYVKSVEEGQGEQYWPFPWSLVVNYDDQRHDTPSAINALQLARDANESDEHTAAEAQQRRLAREASTEPTALSSTSPSPRRPSTPYLSVNGHSALRGSPLKKSQGVNGDAGGKKRKAGSDEDYETRDVEGAEDDVSDGMYEVGGAVQTEASAVDAPLTPERKTRATTRGSASGGRANGKKGQGSANGAKGKRAAEDDENPQAAGVASSAVTRAPARSSKRSKKH